jgi:hypothetical protein
VPIVKFVGIAIARNFSDVRAGKRFVDKRRLHVGRGLCRLV